MKCRWNIIFFQIFIANLYKLCIYIIKHIIYVFFIMLNGNLHSKLFKCEIKYCSTLGQLAYVAIGCEDKNLTRRRLLLETLSE